MVEQGATGDEGVARWTRRFLDDLAAVPERQHGTRLPRGPPGIWKRHHNHVWADRPEVRRLRTGECAESAESAARAAADRPDE